MRRALTAAGVVCVMAAIASGQFGRRSLTVANTTLEDAEFQPARVVYRTIGGAGSRGFSNPWWAIDYPDAEYHFLPALNRLTNMVVAEDSHHLQLTDDEIFEHPFLFLQQPGQGNWSPDEDEAERLREHLARGGFLLIDDFHGSYEWPVVEEALARAMPEQPIIEIPADDSLMHVLYDLGDRLQIPGLRHLGGGFGGQTYVRMEGPPHWRGVYDDRRRLIVGINFNIDMGDAWEHADDPRYPAAMTQQAYRLGVNYVIYALTH